LRDFGLPDFRLRYFVYAMAQKKIKKITTITGSRADSCELSHIQTTGLYGNEVHVLAELQRISPDAVMVLGDRIETALACVLTASLTIPIIHLHGGETTEGALDDNLRHCISKLAYFHFVSRQKYKARLERLGESPDRIFVCGAPGVDTLAETPMSKEECETELGAKFEGRIALVCLHPETLGNDEYNLVQLQGVLKNYDTIIASGANADKGGERINEFWRNCGGRRIFRDTYSSRLWTSLMWRSTSLVGNSSGFAIEGVTLRQMRNDELSIIIIGDRQKGRYEDTLEFCAKERFPLGEPGTVSPLIAKTIMGLDIPKVPCKIFYE
jgi:UDP-hydrolysing UDP-N-acetyl-D-glucosamine 2-epimerase